METQLWQFWAAFLQDAPIHVLAFQLGIVLSHPSQQAAEYNSNGRLSYNPLRSAREQLGPGVYTTPGPGQWAGKPEDWHCLITGLENEIKFMDEVWIPRDYWWNARAMFEYVEENFEDVNLDYAMRLSRVDEHEDITQLLIPDHLVIEYSALFQVIYRSSQVEGSRAVKPPKPTSITQPEVHAVTHDARL
ncbi:hypothetical protein CSUB01_11341 [Colletotrichum sublineola]|uniref:Uncharacterized protein n=1 Tax=Colletotrichum sublineola TaxID=1173701 RepID=A0A066WWI7_COLSU|nr:hypothetical protein CSUB01_11341 [Colletotrichum sublineola]